MSCPVIVKCKTRRKEESKKPLGMLLNRPEKSTKRSKKNDGGTIPEENIQEQHTMRLDLRLVCQAAEHVYSEYKIQSRRPMNCLTPTEAWKWTMYDVTDGKVTDWLAGKTPSRPGKTVVLPSEMTSRMNSLHVHIDSQGGVANTERSVYSFHNDFRKG